MKFSLINPVILITFWISLVHAGTWHNNNIYLQFIADVGDNGESILPTVSNVDVNYTYITKGDAGDDNTIPIKQISHQANGNSKYQITIHSERNGSREVAQKVVSCPTGPFSSTNPGTFHEHKGDELNGKPSKLNFFIVIDLTITFQGSSFNCQDLILPLVTCVSSITAALVGEEATDVVIPDSCYDAIKPLLKSGAADASLLWELANNKNPWWVTQLSPYEFLSNNQVLPDNNNKFNNPYKSNLIYCTSADNEKKMGYVVFEPDHDTGDSFNMTFSLNVPE